MDKQDYGIERSGAISLIISNMALMQVCFRSPQ